METGVQYVGALVAPVESVTGVRSVFMCSLYYPQLSPYVT